MTIFFLFSSRKKRSKMAAKPADATLYARVVADAKARFDVWPSAYASGWVVRRYKALGGRYKDNKDAKKGVAAKPLARWFREEWVDACALPRVVPCGRPKATGNDDYPYCRPRKRVSPKTPKTIGELTAAELASRCARKRQDPSKKIMPGKKKHFKK